MSDDPFERLSPDAAVVLIAALGILVVLLWGAP